MKKLLVIAIAALGMISATVSFADALNGAAGKPPVIKSTRLNVNKMNLHMVDVTVNNRSDNGIFVKNPPFVNDYIESGANDRLYADSYGNVWVQIVNAYNGAVILNQNVCNRAVITVKGSFNSVYVQPIDGSLCF